MILTIDLDTCRIVVNPDWNWATLTPHLTGNCVRMTIPELIEALTRIKNDPGPQEQSA